MRKPRPSCPGAGSYEAVHQPSCGDGRWLSCDSPGGQGEESKLEPEEEDMIRIVFLLLSITAASAQVAPKLTLMDLPRVVERLNGCQDVTPSGTLFFSKMTKRVCPGHGWAMVDDGSVVIFYNQFGDSSSSVTGRGASVDEALRDLAGAMAARSGDYKRAAESVGDLLPWN